MATFYALNFESGRLPADDVSGLNMASATLFGSAFLVPGLSGEYALSCVAGGVRVSGAVLAGSIEIGFGIRVKLNSTTTGFRTAVAHANAAGTDYVFALYASDASGFVRARVAGTDITTTTSIRDGLEHHLALSYYQETGATEIYVDGVQVGSGTVPGVATFGGTQPITFGHSAIESKNLDGIIDDFMIQQEPIFPGDAAIMNNNQVYERNIASWGFDEVTGTLARDSHIKSNSRRKNLTLTGAGQFVETFRPKRGGALKNLTEGTPAAEWLGAGFGDWDRLGFQAWCKMPAVTSDRAICRLANPDGTVRWEGGVGPNNTLYLKYRPDGAPTQYTRRTTANAYTPGTPFAFYLGNTPVGDYWFTATGEATSFVTPTMTAWSAPPVPAYADPADLSYLISGVGKIQICEVGEIDDLRLIANHWQASFLGFAQTQVPSAAPLGTPVGIGLPASPGDRGVWTSTASQNLGAPQTAAIPKPANLADGDLLIAAMHFRDVWSAITVTPTPPPGWTRIVFPAHPGGPPPNQVSDTVRGATQFYWKRVTDAASEPATYNFVWPITFRGAAVIGRFSGVDLALPINASSNWYGPGANGTTGLTTEADDSTVLVLHSADESSVGSASGYLPVASATPGSNTPSVAILAQDQGEAGAVGRPTVSPTGGFGMISLTPAVTSEVKMHYGDKDIIAVHYGAIPVQAVHYGDQLLFE